MSKIKYVLLCAHCRIKYKIILNYEHRNTKPIVCPVCGTKESIILKIEHE